ncbi:hypothetical protein [uncultured Lutibacter sp.]|uniref:hypothetical protein n=1 Tax=uncultured Lutibacter sp. TaxID=437739 RepID=UPI0026348CB5|nr:hypothetical protein [uncultured Lutibacter sp.]
MKKTILLIAIIVLFTNCSKVDDNVDKQINYTTIIGNTYITKQNLPYESRDAYRIYKMNTNGTISQEIRFDSPTGEIYQTMNGSYEYNHPSLELTIQHSIDVCSNCFNYFTANVRDDFKSFSYTIFDLPTGTNKELVFNIVE